MKVSLGAPSFWRKEGRFELPLDLSPGYGFRNRHNTILSSFHTGDPDGNRTRISRLRAGLPNLLADRVEGFSCQRSEPAMRPAALRGFDADRRAAPGISIAGSISGASDGIRTRIILLGRQTLYLVSFTRDTGAGDRNRTRVLLITKQMLKPT